MSSDKQCTAEHGFLFVILKQWNKLHNKSCKVQDRKRLKRGKNTINFWSRKVKPKPIISAINKKGGNRKKLDQNFTVFWAIIQLHLLKNWFHWTIKTHSKVLPTFSSWKGRAMWIEQKTASNEDCSVSVLQFRGCVVDDAGQMPIIHLTTSGEWTQRSNDWPNNGN